MTFLYRYFKLLFSDDEQLMAKWNQLPDGEGSEKYRKALAKELQKRDYLYNGVDWVKSQT